MSNFKKLRALNLLKKDTPSEVFKNLNLNRCRNTLLLKKFLGRESFHIHKRSRFTTTMIQDKMKWCKVKQGGVVYGKNEAQIFPHGLRTSPLGGRALQNSMGGGLG